MVPHFSLIGLCPTVSALPLVCSMRGWGHICVLNVLDHAPSLGHNCLLCLDLLCLLGLACLGIIEFCFVFGKLGHNVWFHLVLPLCVHNFIPVCFSCCSYLNFYPPTLVIKNFYPISFLAFKLITMTGVFQLLP